MGNDYLHTEETLVVAGHHMWELLHMPTYQEYVRKDVGASLENEYVNFLSQTFFLEKFQMKNFYIIGTPLLHMPSNDTMFIARHR